MKYFKKVITAVIGSVLIITLTACSTETAGKSNQSDTDSAQKTADQTDKDGKYTIGFVANFLSHEYYQREIQGLKKMAAENDVEVLVADSNSDVTTQINNIENFITNKVDAMIIVPIDTEAIKGVVGKAEAAGIPCITESNPVEGAKTVVGADYIENGRKMGTWLGEKLNADGVKGEVLIIGFPEFSDTVKIEKGFTEALAEVSPDTKIAATVNGKANKESSLVAATDALTANPNINCIMGINDDSALGGIQAYKIAGKDTSKLYSVTHGVEGNPGIKAILEEKTLSGGYGVFPELLGVSCYDAVMKVLNGEEVPELYVSPMTMLDVTNAGSYYKLDGDEYQLDYDAASKLNQ